MSSRGSRDRKGLERERELKLKAQYVNKLPDVPFQPKFLPYPFDPLRSVPGFGFRELTS